MKKILLALSLFSTAAFAQAQEYTLKGKVSNDCKSLVLLQYETNQKDTLNLVNGEFTYKGNANGHVYASLIADNSIKLPLLLEGNVNVDFTKGTVSGSAENDTFSKWNLHFNEIQNKMMALNEELNSYRKKQQPVPDEVKERVSKDYENLEKQWSNDILTCCRGNADKKFPAYYIAQFYYQMPQDKVLELIDAKPVYMNTTLVAPIMKIAEGWRRQEVGRTFTDFSMEDPQGTMRKLSDFIGNGKYVLVDFWASWCGPCRASMPAFKKLYDQYHAKGFDIVGVSFDQKKQAWVDAIKKLDLPWHHISDLKGWRCEAGAIYGIFSIPATLLIGPDGKIVASGLHAEELAKKLAEIYK